MKIPDHQFHFVGPLKPAVTFVITDGSSPTIEERLRGEPLVNEDGVAFAKRYLEPLGLTREQVAIAWCNAESVDAAWFESPVVWLGKSLPGIGHQAPPSVTLPRFARVDGGVWKASHHEEVDRKLRALRRILDGDGTTHAPSIRPLLKAARPHDVAGISNAKVARLFKADEPKRIVYGVVLDPYQVDLQGDWIPPADIEKTAHDFVSKRGYISYQHAGMAQAELVESFVEPYPSATDEQKAMRNEPHRAYRRKYGGDVVHSGAWVMAVRLSPSLWDEYKTGNLNAFSIEGYGTRTPATAAAMPQVTFVDLEALG